MTSPRAMILSGSGRYADPWHSFDQTTDLLARLATNEGWEVSIRDDIDTALAEGLHGVDLLIVNAGDPWRSGDDEPETGDTALIEQGRVSLASAFGRGMSMLGMHAAASSLRDYPEFCEALGGAWIPGKSWHPTQADIHVRTFHDLIVEGLCDFTVHDERYTDLVIASDIEPLLCAHCDDENTDIVLAWAHRYQGSSVVYDALGHDCRSFESCGHKSFLRRVLSWLSPHTY